MYIYVRMCVCMYVCVYVYVDNQHSRSPAEGLDLLFDKHIFL